MYMLSLGDGLCPQCDTQTEDTWSESSVGSAFLWKLLKCLPLVAVYDSISRVSLSLIKERTVKI